MALLQDYNKLFEHTNNIKKIYVNNSIVWPTFVSSAPPGPDYTEPFYVENITNANETLTISRSGGSSAPALTIQYSSDRTNWSNLGSTTSTLTKTLTPGQKIYLRCNTNHWSSGSNYYNRIYNISKVGGNIMSLLYGSNFTGNEKRFPTTDTYIFNYIFGGTPTNKNTILLSANELLLPATTLTDYCYSYMFRYCTVLASAPELPATTLKNSCYASMFQECSLTETPLLPAKILVNRCYFSMFLNCSKLNKVTCLATSNINVSNSTYKFVNGASAAGTFIKAKGVTWPSGQNGIPSGWTVTEV